MKRCILVAIVLLGAFNSYCQKYEWSVSYSPLSIYGIEKMIDGKVPGQSKYFVLGAINADYYTYLNIWLKLGVNVMYDRAFVEGAGYRYGYGYGYGNEFEYSASKSALVFSPQIDFEYLRHPKFRMSSGIAVGYAMERFSNKAHISGDFRADGVTAHLNLISFRWGQKSGLTGNLGVGYKGLLSLGYFVRF